MNPRRLGAALLVAADSAGTIASSRGSARAAPTPRRNVRRGKAIFVMIIYLLSLITYLLLTRGCGRARLVEARPAHLKRRALHDPEHERRDAIVVARGIADHRPHDRVVVVLQAPPQRIRQQVLGQRRDELL